MEKNDDEISLKEILQKGQSWLKYLFSKWFVILIAGLLGGAAGLIYAYSQKPIYSAELSFALEDSQAGGGGLSAYAGIASQFGIDMGSGGGVFMGDNLIEFMKSRSMVEKALLTAIEINGHPLTLAELYIDIYGVRKKWHKDLATIHFPPYANRAVFTRQQDSLLGSFHRTLIKNNLSVSKVDKKLSIISVKVNSVDELFSKFFAEILVKEVSDFYVETRTKKSADNLEVLQSQTDSVRRVLNSAISGVATSTDYNPNPNPAIQVLRVPSQRKQVDVQANTAILTELVKNLEISKISLRRETPLIQVIDKPILPLPKSKPSNLFSLIAGGIITSLITVFYLTIVKMLRS